MHQSSGSFTVDPCFACACFDTCCSAKCFRQSDLSAFAPADAMAQTSARSMGQTMSVFKPGATLPAAAMGASMAAIKAAVDTMPMGSPRAAAKGSLLAAMGNTMGSTGRAMGNTSGDMNTTMNSTGSRTSRSKFLKWFNSLSPRQGQKEDVEASQLDHSRCVNPGPLGLDRPPP